MLTQIFLCVSTSDWVLIGTTAVLAILSLFVQYWSERLKRRFFRPRLIINYDEKLPACHVTFRSGINTPVYFFRFEVTN
jgi:hypothetical protein